MIIFFVIAIFSCGIIQRVFSDQSVKTLCNRIDEIKVIPFKDEYVEDEVYNKIVKIGVPIIPYLIDKILDTNKMNDPRKAPPYNGVTVGDVAFFVLLNITEQRIQDFLPESIQDKFEKQGVYAYFKFVENSKSRIFIQKKLRQRYNDKSLSTHY
jgi:hypothetical protein